MIVLFWFLLSQLFIKNNHSLNVHPYLTSAERDISQSLFALVVLLFPKRFIAGFYEAHALADLQLVYYSLLMYFVLFSSHSLCSLFFSLSFIFLSIFLFVIMHALYFLDWQSPRGSRNLVTVQVSGATNERCWFHAYILELTEFLFCAFLNKVSLELNTSIVILRSFGSVVAARHMSAQ